jgi:AraC-like DNA-binding protein
MADMQFIARVKDAHRERWKPGEVSDKRGPSPHYCLWCVEKGSGDLHVDDTRFRLRPGDCFFHRAVQSQFATTDPEDLLTILWASFTLHDRNGRELPGPGEDHGYLPREHRRLREPIFFFNLFRRVIEGVAVERLAGPTTPRLGDTWMNVLLLELNRQDRPLERAGLEMRQSDRVNRICRQIQLEPEKHYRIAAMARKVGYSPDHFSRVFRKLVGVGPREFVVQARIEEAKRLLLDTGLAVGQVADRLGYRSVYFFSRQFRAKTGMTPTEHRKRNTGATPE